VLRGRGGRGDKAEAHEAGTVTGHEMPRAPPPRGFVMTEG
jgi:hypothetical protein